MDCWTVVKCRLLHKSCDLIWQLSTTTVSHSLFPIRILPEAKFSTLSGFTAFISSSRPFREYSAILNVIKYSCYSTRLLKGDLQILHIIFFLFTFEEGKNIEGMCITTDPQDLKEARIKRLQRSPFQSYTPDLWGHIWPNVPFLQKTIKLNTFKITKSKQFQLLSYLFIHTMDAWYILLFLNRFC